MRHRVSQGQAQEFLASKYGAGRLELACAKAIAAGDPTYRTIKGVLAAGLEADPVPPRPATAGGGVPARPVAAVRERGGMPTPNTATTSDDHGGSDEPRAGVSA